jgi:hypothetical protein
MFSRSKHVHHSARAPTKPGKGRIPKNRGRFEFKLSKMLTN